MRKRAGWLATAAATAVTLIGGVVLAQAATAPDEPDAAEPAAVVGLDLDDIALDLGALGLEEALTSCATTDFVDDDPGSVELLYGQQQLTPTSPAGSFVLRNGAGKVMFCDMFGDDYPAVLPLPTTSATRPAVMLTNNRRQITCSKAAEIAQIRTNLWLAVTDQVESARTRFWVDGVAGPWFGAAQQGGYLHLQSWLLEAPASSALELETQVLDGSGDPVAVPGMPSGPRSLLVSCGVELG